MRVLVACEYSGRVREAFRALGHDAWSCDLLPSEDFSPYHYQCDVVGLLGMGWDLMVAHPPCTHLAVSGSRWFKDKVREQDDALDFVRLLMAAPIHHIAIENPVSVISSRIRKPDQIVQPWQFGHGETKATCLWLKNLPKLLPTCVVEGRDSKVHRMSPGPDRWKDRSRTYQGLADAMAAQWGIAPEGDPMTPTLYSNAQRRMCIATKRMAGTVWFVQLNGSEVALHTMAENDFDKDYKVETSVTMPLAHVASSMLNLPAKAGIKITSGAMAALESIAKGGDTMTELPFATATITKAPKGLEDKVGQQVDPTAVKKPRKPRSDAGKPRAPKAEKGDTLPVADAPKTRKPRSPKAPVDGAAEIAKIREAAEKKIAAIEAKIAAVEAKLKARAEKEAADKVAAAEKRLAALEAMLAK